MLGIDDLVVHPGSSWPSQKKVEKPIDSLQQVLDKTSNMRVRILLETMADKAVSLGVLLSK